MPYPKQKDENYQNLGGINQKASPFMTGQNEALALLNWDFSAPGAYTQRPGTSTYLGGASGAINSFTEFSRLSGASWKIWNVGSQLFSFNGTTHLLRNLGNTFGSSSLGFTFLASSFTILDMQPFVDRLWVAGANGDFCKTDGTTSYAFGIPPNTVIPNNLQVTEASSGFTGWYQYALAYVNDRGLIGPVLPIPPTGGTYSQSSGVLNLAVAGATSIRLGMPSAASINAQNVGALNVIIDQYGLTQIVIFRSGPFAAPSTGSGPTFIGSLFDIGIVPIGTTYFFDYGSTLGPLNPTGTSAAYFTWFPQTNDIYTPGFRPRYLNTYNNYMFYAGFSALPSTAYFSNLGEPERIDVDASFEVRNNDGDRLTGMINYRAVQIFAKRYSLHYLTGFSSDQFALQAITDQYGCLSNRAMCVWQDKLWFLDDTGIAEYNGARVATVSNRVERTFRRMNVQAAVDRAEMLHVKDRNEIWTSFPIDGASYNNYLVVYDYVADAFTEWRGPQVSSLALATGPSLLATPFYGDYTGSIHFFDPIFFNDSGRAFTCSFFSRYFGDLGFSVTKQFRRLFFDLTMRQPAGATHVISTSLFSDFNSNSVQFQATFAVSSSLPQQNRIDFGVPGKTLALELHHLAQDSALQFSGFTVEYRFQRAV